LLRAFALVVKQMPEARLRIFGSAPHGGRAYLQRCRTEAADLGISEQATFEGRVPEIRDAYRAGHIVVLCSITEGFPYTLIEAMACGRACVATDVGGVSEALGEQAGLIVPPPNPTARADACLRLLRDNGLRKAIGIAARERALEHFTVDRAVGAFDEMYTLLGTGRPIPAERLDGTAEPAPGHWIALPPEEASTVIMPRLAGVPFLPADEVDEVDEVDETDDPALLERPVPPDQQVTMVLPQLIDQQPTVVLPQLPEVDRTHEEVIN
jgi:hypothetical protein